MSPTDPRCVCGVCVCVCVCACVRESECVWGGSVYVLLFLYFTDTERIRESLMRQQQEIMALQDFIGENKEDF